MGEREREEEIHSGTGKETDRENKRERKILTEKERVRIAER